MDARNWVSPRVWRYRRRDFAQHGSPRRRSFDPETMAKVSSVSATWSYLSLPPITLLPATLLHDVWPIQEETEEGDGRG